MRSVVVVLPASMWATMPMFRILSSDTLITTPNYGTGDSGPGTGHILTPVPSPKSRLWLPSIMRKCLIRFGHAVRVLALLHGAALPGSITLLTSRCTITLLYIGSGPTSRCGACPFLGISLPSSFELQLCVVQLESWKVRGRGFDSPTLQLFNSPTPLLGPFGPILAAALPPLCHTRRVDGSADDVIADAWQIGDAAAANQDHGVLLQVMADAGDV